MRISLFLLRQCSDQRVDVPVSNRADGTSPVEADPLFVKMSFNVALMADHHASHHETYIAVS